MAVAGPRLPEIRLDQRLTPQEVTEDAGITKGFLSLAERRRTRVSKPTLLSICQVLDVKIGTLFDVLLRR